MRALIVSALICAGALGACDPMFQSYKLSAGPRSLDTSWVELRATRPWPAGDEGRELELFLSPPIHDFRIGDAQLFEAEEVLVDGQRVPLSDGGSSAREGHQVVCMWPGGDHLSGGPEIATFRVRAVGSVRLDSIVWVARDCC